MANRDQQPDERYDDDHGRRARRTDRDDPPRDDFGRDGGYGESRQFQGEHRQGEHRAGATRYEDYGQHPQGVRQDARQDARQNTLQGGGDRYGQDVYGDRSGSGAYGEGGFMPRSGSGGYGAEGYGGQDFRSEGRYGQAGGTYSQRDYSNAARRSLSHEDQRYGDHNSLGETYGRGYRQREEEYGAVSRNAQYGGDYRSKYDPLYEQAAGRAGHVGHYQREHDEKADEHAPHYRRWREERLAGHDRDYAHWRDEQARRYDDDYHGWRDERRQTFARDFNSWRQGRGGGAADETAILGDDSPTGPSGGATGLTGASTGTSGEAAGLGGGATGVSHSGGGATGAAQISGGASGVAAAVSDAANMGWAAAAHLEGTTRHRPPSPAGRRAAGAAGADPVEGPSNPNAGGPVEGVTEGRTGGERRENEKKKP